MSERQAPSGTVEKPTRGIFAGLMQQLLAHAGIAVLLAISLILVNSWIMESDRGYLHALGALWGFLCGLGLSHIVHEWCHYGGAVLAKSTLILKPRVHPLFFDFDFPQNSAGQFLCLSLGGLVGNVLLIILLIALPASGGLVLTSALAAAIGQFVFVLVLELPVSLEVMAGREPLKALEQHFGQGGPLFLRAGLLGGLAATLVLLLW